MPPGPPMRARGGGVKRADGGEVYAPSEAQRRRMDERIATDAATKAKGGGVKAIGMDVGTKVQHVPGKKKADHRTVTFKAAGGTVSFRASGGGVIGKGGTPKTADQGSKLPGGSGGGEARLAKAHKR